MSLSRDKLTPLEQVWWNNPDTEFGEDHRGCRTLYYAGSLIAAIAEEGKVIIIFEPHFSGPLMLAFLKLAKQLGYDIDGLKPVAQNPQKNNHAR